MSSRLNLKETHRRILWVLLFSALFFSVIAVVQYKSVEHQVTKNAHKQLDVWTKEVKDAVLYVDHWDWDLKKYRNAVAQAPQYYVIAENGVVIDIEGFIADLIPSPKFQMLLEPSKPTTLTTFAGEKWRLLLKKIKGGSVVLGISDPKHLKEADETLITNAERFSNLDVELAAKLSTRETDYIVDYAVFDTPGNLRMHWGGIPLEYDRNNLKKFIGSPIQQRKIGEKDYLIMATPITDNSNKTVGIILVPLDFSSQRDALQAIKRFNFVVAVLSWVTVILLSSWYFVSNERAKRKYQISLEEALNKGECQTVEFKETLEFDLNTKASSQVVLKSALRTVAGFLNSVGGTLFIGVSDKGEIKGIERDFGLCNKKKGRF